ncbi:sap145 [Candida jiufengensis]|uniref:sap145 n=1 Tax=Candida jiufengensis TaxID=497108 RepID=UPI00222406EC|nr:sap145 [Candida jiufengensis]KAI5957275.1 sap145 [Candida jiufengensis]
MAQKRTKNQLRREKNKKKKLEDNEKTDEQVETNQNGVQEQLQETTESTTNILNIDENKDLLREFESVFNKFNKPSPPPEEQSLVPSNERDEDFISGSPTDSLEVIIQPESDQESASESSEEQNQESNKLSKRQLRLRNKVPLSSLKLSTHKPELVEPYDVDAQDPFLLVYLKSQPNTIPVPAHWSSKRDYLSSKRGIERPPFKLPKFIRDTGIEEMRQVINPDDKTMKQQQREKFQVKLGKLDIDYNKLYRAFFQNQTKPRVSKFGELYEEGKELIDEMTLEIKNFKPGVISSELRHALGMSDDVNVKPAWITIMEDIGKPPSYKELIIPGLDEVYNNNGYKDKYAEQDVNYEHFGRIRTFVESESEEDEDSEDEEDEEEEQSEEQSEEEQQQEELPKQISTLELLSGLN